jgi:hypothetical protein
MIDTLQSTKQHKSKKKEEENCTFILWIVIHQKGVLVLDTTNCRA